MKHKKQTSWKDVLRINWQAFQTLYEIDRQSFLASTCHSIWESLTPYIGIYLSALVIGELAGNRDPQRLLHLVLITLGTSALLALGSALLWRWRETTRPTRWYKLFLRENRTLLDMDFSILDDPETLQTYSTIRQFRGGSGQGMVQIFGSYEILLSSVCTLLGGIALTVTLFVTPVPDSAGSFTALNHPLFLLLVITVMLAVTFLAPTFSTKAGSYWTKNSGNHSKDNRSFSFYGFILPSQTKLAMDVRMYRLARQTTSQLVRKDGIFASNGIFAQLARGPMGLYNAASGAASVIFTGFAYAFVCLKAWAGAFGIGQVTQYVAAITKVADGLSSLLSELGRMRNNAPFLQQELDFLNIPNQMYQGTIPVEKRSDNEYEIAFKNVSFRYPGSDEYALRNVSFQFKVGQRLAVVGMNGSGKTTMIKLLCRLYDPTEGEISLNGIDIRKYDYLEYLSVFSVVFQDFKLFAFELGQNVASGPDHDEARVKACLEKAGFGSRLSQLPDGLRTHLYKDVDENGVEISGGEAQKIAIARALYKNAPFVILDEPTAALDPVAEAEIYSKFNEIIEDKTAIYISHRLSSCKFCDEIVVFDHGQVIQQGTHEALLADETGKYHELWNAQAQYYVSEQK